MPQTRMVIQTSIISVPWRVTKLYKALVGWPIYPKAKFMHVATSCTRHGCSATLMMPAWPDHSPRPPYAQSPQLKCCPPTSAAEHGKALLTAPHSTLWASARKCYTCSKLHAGGDPMQLPRTLRHSDNARVTHVLNNTAPCPPCTCSPSFEMLPSHFSGLCQHNMALHTAEHVVHHCTVLLTAQTHSLHRQRQAYGLMMCKASCKLQC
jgi:hypothetical protein